MSLGTGGSRALYLPIPRCAVGRRNAAADADGLCSGVDGIAASGDAGVLGGARVRVGYARSDKQRDEGPGLDLPSARAFHAQRP